VPVMSSTRSSRGCRRATSTTRAFYVVGFFFPVVAAGQGAIRTQLSATTTSRCSRGPLESFKKVGAKHGILGLDKKGIIRSKRALVREKGIDDRPGGLTRLNKTL